MSQYFPETMVVFTTTVSGIIKTDSGSGAERLCWRNLMAARSDIRRAQRLIVCVWDYPQDQSYHRLCTFSTAAAAIFLKISLQNNLLQRADREEVKGCSLQPFCDIFWLSLHQCISALFVSCASTAPS